MIKVSEIVEVSDEDVATNVNIHGYGLDSFKLVQLTSSLINYYAIEIVPTIFYGYTTIRELSQYFLEGYSEVLREFNRKIYRN